MSIYIGDDLIWVSIPRCASTSIERALLKSKLDIKHFTYNSPDIDNMKHFHIKLTELNKKFGLKESICIKRDFFSRWISGLQHMYTTYKFNKIETNIEWEDIDNDFIYNTLTPEIIDTMHSLNLTNPYYLEKSERKLIKESINDFNSLFTKERIEYDAVFNPYALLLSQRYWKNNSECTYEFDINNISDFEKFISNRYNIEFKLNELNKTIPIKNKIIKDDKLRNWVYDNFEKRFIKNNNLI